VSENTPVMSDCEAMMVAAVESADEGVRGGAGGDHGEERVGDGAGVAQDERPLTEVAEHERREDEGEPRQADGPCAEVAHVGVERLAAGDREHDDAEDGKAPDSPWRAKYRAPHFGESAASTLGFFAMCHAPSDAMQRTTPS
jgi:hypothetical protein